jgi:hypothetical protein
MSSLDEQMPIYRTTNCPSCGKDLKICLNCRFYEKGAHWDCRETISEPVRDKEKANFCDYFSIRSYTPAEAEALKKNGMSKAEKKQKEARSKLDDLFGNG